MSAEIRSLISFMADCMPGSSMTTTAPGSLCCRLWASPFLSSAACMTYAAKVKLTFEFNTYASDHPLYFGFTFQASHAHREALEKIDVLLGSKPCSFCVPAAHAARTLIIESAGRNSAWDLPGIEEIKKRPAGFFHLYVGANSLQHYLPHSVFLQDLPSNHAYLNAAAVAHLQITSESRISFYSHFASSLEFLAKVVLGSLGIRPESI